MIKYDYTVKRDEGDEIKEYKPNLIPKQLSDLVYIQGPNSSGKSTLLNLIALGFFAEKLKDDELNPALREKIEELRNSKHQELVFEIEIQNESIGTTIKSIKGDFKNKDFKVVEVVNGKEKPISSTEFMKEYKLIYDIPTDPIRRLPELLKELKNSQESVENNIVRLRRKIDDAIKGIKEGKNPDLLKELEELIKSLNKKQEKLTDKIESEEKWIKWFKELHYLKHFLHYNNLLKQIVDQIEEAEKSKTSTEKKEQRLSKKAGELISRIKLRVSRGVDLYEDITTLLELIAPKDLKHRLNIWKTLNCANEIKEPNVHNDLKEEVRFFLNFFKNVQFEDKDATFSEARFLIDLYTLLKDFRHTDISVPGTGKNIDEFIEILEQEIQNKEGSIYENENINTCIKNLDELLSILNDSVGDSGELESLKEQHTEALFWVNEETESGLIEQLKEKRQTAENKLNFYIKELGQININLSEADKKFKYLQVEVKYELYKSYTENQLSDRINNSESELVSKKEEQKKLKRELEIAIGDKKRIEKKKPHKYQEYLIQLESIRKGVLQLESKFSNDFYDHIKKIMSKEVDAAKLSKEQKIYAEKVSEFLAAKVRFIKHIDDNYEIKKMDIVGKEIITTSGKRIRFTDLGTGQGQAAYLQGLISMNENRKIIALFDEVAMMDSKTLQPIFNKLQELYNRKKLLLGIIVQRRDDKVDVRSLMDK